MKVVINPSYVFLADFINNLPDCFDSEGEVIYKGRNEIRRYSVQGVALVVKSFKVPICLNRVVYTFIRKSKAARSYLYARELLSRGFNSPDPIAYVETYSGGLIKRSFFVSIYDSESETVRSLMAGEDILDTENKLSSFARFTAQLHEAGIYHIDYSPGNVLIKTLPDCTYSFSLIDINRMKFQPVSPQNAYANMARMCTSKVTLSFIAKEYAKVRGWNTQETDRQMTYLSDRYFKEYAYHLAWKIWRKSGGSILNNPVWKYKIYFWLSKFSFTTPSCKNKLLLKKQKLYEEYIAEYDFRKVIF